MYRPESSPVSTSRYRLGYLPGLDGLRAAAVAAVLVFHAEPAWLPGGYLGVEVFFVLSGFLITTLLLGEWRRDGRISLGDFWARRARRLLPALFVLIVAALSYAMVFERAEVVRLREDAIAATAYITNWYLIFGDQPYFAEVERPSYLQHLWSLAVEEQFYLLWPLAFTLLMRAGGLRVALAVTAAGAVASWLLAAALWTPNGDTARVYYGSDTRVGGLLAGAVLAFVMARVRLPGPLVLRSAGIVAAIALAFLMSSLDGASPFLHRGGLALVALLTMVLVTATVNSPGSLMTSALEHPVLRWLGERSYGIYLWHWPIFLITRPGRDLELDGVENFALRVVLTLAAASLSYRLLEQPVRTGDLWRRIRKGHPSFVLGAGGAYSAVLLFGVAQVHSPVLPEYLQDGHGIHVVVTQELSTPAPATPVQATPEPATPVPTTGNETPAEETPVPTESTPAPPSPTPSPTASPVQSEPTRAPDPPGDVLAIGDSVMLAAANRLGIVGRVEVDAVVGRLPWHVPDLLRSRQSVGTLPSVVVIHTGNNGVVSRQTLDGMMAALADVERVVFVNVRVPRDWEAGNNTVFAEAAARYSNVRVVDWYGATAGRGDLFASDGVHPGAAGAALYAELIAAAVAAP